MRNPVNHNVPRERQTIGDMHECLELWAAVGQQAWDDLRHEKETIRASAREWFYSSRTDRCSYLWICSLLDIDPARIRAAVALVEEPKPSPGEIARIAAGARLRQWREQQGIRQSVLARRLGMSQSHFAEYERGRYPLKRLLHKMTEIGIAHNITLH